MTDDESTDSADNESTDPADDESPSPDTDTDTDGPGGGPTRVVSSQSVDDILESLESTPRPDDGPTAAGSSPDATEATDCDENLSDGRDRVEPAGSEEQAPAADAGGRGADGLSARVDAGTVTGADVRAAEAGDGRESTPEVDEISLSLDDLETTRESDGSEVSDPPASAPNSTADERSGSSSDDEQSTASGPSGVLRRIADLFSR